MRWRSLDGEAIINDRLPHPSPASAFVAAATVFLSAFLLFTVELTTAKALLPRFGGSPAVWTTSMLVYQVLLFAGYAYAHGLVRARRGRLQAVAHVTLLALAMILVATRLHVDAFAGGDPAAVSRRPVTALLAALFGTVALPFATLAATCPLIQHWRQRMYPGRPGYWLYAVSNAGSFAGLLAYPFAIEPMLGLKRQFTAWSALFAATALGLGLLAVRAGRSGATLPPDPPSGRPPPPAARIRRRDAAQWLVLPAATSALLLAATNELCQDLAVFPFLWVFPLALYLLSYVLAFRGRPAPNALPAAAVTTLAALATSALSPLLPAPVHVVSIGAMVFSLCLAAHRELYRVRPPAECQTVFYLCVTAGSGAGAAAVALAAPVLFGGFWEFPSAILAVWLAVVAAVALDPAGCLRAGDARHAAVLLGLLFCLAANRIPEDWLRECLPAAAGGTVLLRVGAAAALAALVWYAGLRRLPVMRSAVWPRLLAGLVVFLTESCLAQRVRDERSGPARASRNFFGVVRVQEVLHPASGVRLRQLIHGRINHGWQYLNPELRAEPTAYHSPSTGIGRLLRAMQGKRDALLVGVTGLGAGALAAYPRAADRIVFYEIDPQVVQIASGAGAAFGFVEECAGEVDVVLGDARQSLRRELVRQGSRNYDVLALDAFSSDAVPMHLLTREAMALYLAHLARPGGVLAVNISNRFLDLEPVLADAAATFSLDAILVDSTGDPPVRARSLWVLMARQSDALAYPALREAARPLTDDRVEWTDTRGSPFPLLKWWTPRSRHLRLMPQRTRRDAVSSPGLSPAQTPGVPEE